MSDLERKLLAKCVDAANIKEAYDIGVRPEMFEEPLYEAIWTFTIDYWRKAQMENAPSEWALKQEFPGYTLAEDAADEVEYYAEKMIERFLSNDLQEMLRTAAKNSVINPRQALKELHAAAYRTAEIATPRNTRVNMVDNLEERWERYTKAKQFPQGQGAPYGLDLLDLLTGGILPGELAVCAAFAKTGKTMALVNAAVAAKRRGYTPIFYSLELSLSDTQQRIDAFWSGISYNRLTHGHQTADEEIALRQGMEELSSLGGIIVERPEEGERTVPYLCARAREVGANYLIIDQLSKLEAGHKTYSTKEEYRSILAQIKNDIGRAGRELSALMAVQTRREEGEPNDRSFADAAEIERDVDLAFALHRNRDLRNNHMMLCDILLSRRTDLARFVLEWELSEATRIRILREEAFG